VNFETRGTWKKRLTSTTVSETAGLGTTEYVHIIRSGYSSLILDIKSVPIPAPVPPPSECVIWKPALTLTGSAGKIDRNYLPCKQSVPSASLRTTSRTESTNSAPSV
jgi:hypothetical protein